MQPVLTTARLACRPASATDVDALLGLLTDADVRRYLCDDRILTRTEVAAMLEDAAGVAPQGLGLWLLVPRASGAASDRVAQRPFGCAGLLPVSTAAEYDGRLAGLVEPLVALAPAVWGQGYAHEALTALQAYAAGPLGLAELAGVTDVPNVASDRMLRRAGFVVLGEVAGPKYPLRTYRWSAAAQVQSGVAAG
jgi:ribosomal-protein-alanine N-acetyltransferase